MAGSPRYKVYDANNLYQAACKELEAAAALVALYGTGSSIRLGHRAVLWTEGYEAQEAGESYDAVAELADARERQLSKAAYARACSKL